MLPEHAEIPVLSLGQVKDVTDIVYNMIDHMDNYAIAELFSGDEKDVDKIIQLLLDETAQVIHGNNFNRIKPEKFGYLNHLSAEVTETLRCQSLNYFIMDVLPNFILGWHNIEWSNLSQIYKFLILLAGRDHGKSHHFSYARPLWQLYRYKSGTGAPKELKMAKEGLIITNERSLSNHFLSMIKEEIEENDILRERLLPDTNKGWGGESIKTKIGSSLFVRSATSKLRGRHPTWIQLDDLLNEGSLYSQEQRDKYWNIFSGVIVPMVEPGGSIHAIGTPFAQGDLYGTIREKRNIVDKNEDGTVKRSFNFPVFEYPAIFPDGTLLFPQRHTFKSLMEKEAILGSLIFSREILVKPISDNASIFPYDGCLRNSIKGQDTVDVVKNIDSSPRKFLKVGVGIDFAISSTTGADYTVITIGGLDELGIVHVLNSIRLHGANYAKQIGACKKVNRDFRPDIMFAEDNGMQEIFIQMLQDANLPVVGKTTTAANKKSLYKGVPRMAALFETGRIKFPYGSQAARDLTDLYHQELNSIAFIPKDGKLESTNQHDDTAMSLWNMVRSLLNDDLDFDFNFM